MNYNKLYLFQSRCPARHRLSLAITSFTWARHPTGITATDIWTGAHQELQQYGGKYRARPS